ncbi:MAG: tetratricopeptide repeat protein [Bacteroidota bacterium]
MTEERNVEMLENYILGNLPEEEKAVVEKRLSEEPELSALFRDLKILMTAIRHESREDLANELKQLESKIHPDPKMKRFNRSTWAIGIAATSVILVVSIVLYFRNQSEPNDELFATNFTPYINIFDPASRAPGDKQALAFRYYDEGNYPAAIAELSKLSKEDPAVRFYLGNALLANNQPADAVGHFKVSLQEGLMPGQSRWYLALCYLKLGDDQNAIYYLETVSTGGSNYAEAAQHLLSELKKK